MYFLPFALLVASMVAPGYSQTSGFDAVLYPELNSTHYVGETLRLTWNATTRVSQNVAGINIFLLAGKTQNTLQEWNDAPLVLNYANEIGYYDFAINSSVPGVNTTGTLYGFSIYDFKDNTTLQYSTPFFIVNNASSLQTSSSSSRVCTPNTYSPYSILSLFSA